MDLTDRYPTLFEPIDDAAATGVFELLDVAPPFELVGHAYMVPALGDEYVYVIRGDGRPQLPGGLLLPGEMPRQALARELLDGGGTQVLDMTIFAGWHLHLKGDAPEAPHLPHPETWRLVYAGGVERVATPSGPADGPRGAEFHAAPLDRVVSVFRAGDREDLAELYWLVDEKRRGLL